MLLIFLSSIDMICACKLSCGFNMCITNKYEHVNKYENCIRYYITKLKIYNAFRLENFQKYKILQQVINCKDASGTRGFFNYNYNIF